ncbi:SDR family oxidoreductase [Streptomyces sp. MS19]|uniref:SDR family oxidoreductase n=1 Tax=Streptomyces sp. MS19 TaxID=3385972 RepID=UPI0039A01097
MTSQAVETPSWAYGNSGTRFKVFAQEGVPRTPREKLEDAAQVHRLTGAAPGVALHIPWDRVDDYAALAAHARDLGLRVGTINANVFQDDAYRLGSVCSPDPAARRAALAHLLGACVVVADLNGDAAAQVAGELGGPDRAVAVTVDVTSEEQIGRAFAAALLAFGGVDLVVNNAGISLSKPLLETAAEDWDLQHAIMARGSFLVSRAAARVMLEQGMGGDIAYGAAKADQAHQVRLLAAELGPHGVRVNGVNPDGVVRGSGIFAGGWGARRAAVYGVPEEKLGEYYARRTLLKREVLPEHVANAAFLR